MIYTCGGGRMEVTVEHGEVELLKTGAEAGQERVNELYLWWRENGMTVGHGEMELLQPGAEAGQKTVNELYLWWKENGSDSGA